jgi:hypothetical protein
MSLKVRSIEADKDESFNSRRRVMNKRMLILITFGTVVFNLWAPPMFIPENANNFEN